MLTSIATTSTGPAAVRSAVPDQEAIRVALELLRARGMDVVFVGHYRDGDRRFRVVQTLSHGRAAALVTGHSDGGTDGGVLLEAPVLLLDGRLHGMLCCHTAGTDPAATERDLRSLRHGARLAARLLDNEQVLMELSRQALSH